VIGAILLDPERMIDVAPLLTPDDFHDPVHEAIYAATEKLYEQREPIDYLTVAQALASDDKVQRAGGSAFLAELAANVPTSSHAARYAALVKEMAVKRRLGQLGREIQEWVGNQDATGADVLERVEQRLLALGRQSDDSKPQRIADLAVASYERYMRLQQAEDKTACLGVTTGFGKLDHLLTGLAPGHLMILAARPSMGKTSLALDIARNVAGAGRSVTFFSLEMSKLEIMDRIIAAYLGVETWKVKKADLTDDEFRRMGPLIDELKSMPIYIDDDPDTTLTNLRSKARRHKMEHELDLLIVDYLQLVEVTDRLAKENNTQRITFISRGLKNLARELQCPLVVLSQLSRAPENRSPPIPVLSDLRDSGAIEQDADTVVMLYRESYYNEDCEKPDVTDILLRKNRHGPTGKLELRFDAERMRFIDAERWN
jgi:replicative DNA helicase